MQRFGGGFCSSHSYTSARRLPFFLGRRGSNGEGGAMKSRWLALIALLFGTYAAVPAIARIMMSSALLRLLWCSEQSPIPPRRTGCCGSIRRRSEAVIPDWLYAAIFHGRRSDAQSAATEHSLAIGTYERRGDQAWAHVFLSIGILKSPARSDLHCSAYLRSIQGDSAWHHLFPLFSPMSSATTTQATLCSVRS